MKVLIAEDNLELADTIQQLLQAWGHEAHTCGDGKDTLRDFVEKTYDLVLTEALLPDMRGDELISRLRTLSPDIRVVAMTWNNSRELESRIRAKGVLYYMVKPFEAESLRSLLEHLSGKSRNLRKRKPRGRLSSDAAWRQTDKQS